MHEASKELAIFAERVAAHHTVAENHSMVTKVSVIFVCQFDLCGSVRNVKKRELHKDTKHEKYAVKKERGRVPEVLQY